MYISFQFPFYDAVPHELFSQIKSAQYTFHNEVRVSEDTKGIIAKLLVVQPQARLTATELRTELEEVIMAWRARIPPPPRDAQKVASEFLTQTLTADGQTNCPSNSRCPLATRRRRRRRRRRRWPRRPPRSLAFRAAIAFCSANCTRAPTAPFSSPASRDVRRAPTTPPTSLAGSPSRG